MRQIFGSFRIRVSRAYVTFCSSKWDLLPNPNISCLVLSMKIPWMLWILLLRCGTKKNLLSRTFELLMLYMAGGTILCKCIWIPTLDWGLIFSYAKISSNPDYSYAISNSPLFEIWSSSILGITRALLICRACKFCGPLVRTLSHFRSRNFGGLLLSKNSSAHDHQLGSILDTNYWVKCPSQILKPNCNCMFGFELICRQLFQIWKWVWRQVKLISQAFKTNWTQLRWFSFHSLWFWVSKQLLDKKLRSLWKSVDWVLITGETQYWTQS